MKRTPSMILYERAGSPASPTCAPHAPFRCWVCAGESTRGVLVERFMGANFVGQNRVRCPDSPLVCAACVFVMSGKPPDTLRMYSHLVDDRGWLKLNKGDKPAMRAWLRAPKEGEWFAAIADSGKKHVVPWAPLNAAGAHPGLVLFEERPVTLGDFGDVDRIADLLTLGATKAEIDGGDYTPRAWQLCGAALRDFEHEVGRAKRSGGWFELAVWLAQRDEERVAARLEADKSAKAKAKEDGRAHRSAARTATKRDRGAPARDAGGVPAHTGREPAQKLGSLDEPLPRGGADVGERRAPGDGHGAGAETRGPQLGLFGGGTDAGRPRARARRRA